VSSPARAVIVSSLPAPPSPSVLGELLAVDRSRVTEAIREIRPLLEEHRVYLGAVILAGHEPAPTKSSSSPLEPLP
jgi:hypothetical protein